MSIITVSGQMGSLRDELAQELCKSGRLECVDRRTLMDAVAGLVDMSRDEHQLLAEQGPALLDLNPRRRRIFAAMLESVVLQYACKGDAVLVGRGTNILLRLVPGVLRVRTVAPLEIRAQRMAASEGLSMDRARQLATAVDQQRSTYISHILHGDWASPLNYDLVLNMGRLSLEQAATTVLDLAAHPEFQPGSETERQLTELVLASQVRRALVERLDIHSLEIEALGGRVVLHGYVASQADHDGALEAARQVEGVEELISELEISSTLSRLLS